MAADAPLCAAATGLIDRLPVGVLVARGDEALFANRTLLDYLGYDDLQSLTADGGLARVFFGPASKDFARQPTFQPVSIEAQDGDPVDADAHLQIVEWDGAGPATLITLRRRRIAGAAASDNPAVLAILDAIGDAALLVSREGRILRANDAFAALAGLAKPAVVGQDLLTFVTEDGWEENASKHGEAGSIRIASGRTGAGRAVRDRLSRASDVGAQPLRVVLKTAREGGRPRRAQMSARSLGPGAEGALCVLLRDLSATEHSPEELEAARSEAERSSAAKRNFWRASLTRSNAAERHHQLRRSDDGGALGPIGSERYKDYLKDVHASGEHVLSLVNDLLDLSKIEAGKMELSFEPVDANAVIAECVSIMQAQADRERVVIRWRCRRACRRSRPTNGR